MVVNDQYVMTGADVRRQRIEAEIAHEEAEARLACLIQKLKVIGGRARSIIALVDRIELAPANPLQSESNLLMLSPSSFDELNFETIRAIANSIVLVRKEVAEALTLKNALGRRA